MVCSSQILNRKLLLQIAKDTIHRRAEYMFFDRYKRLPLAIRQEYYTITIIFLMKRKML